MAVNSIDKKALDRAKKNKAKKFKEELKRFNEELKRFNEKPRWQSFSNSI